MRGALLVVDAGQVEAHRSPIATRQLSRGRALPVLNKMDLLQVDPERVQQEIEEIIGIDATEAVPASAKTGMGIEDAEYPLRKCRFPDGDREAPLQALIIDSCSIIIWASSLW